MEKPGYRLQPFVARFLDTVTGPVPQVKTSLDRSDRVGTVSARLGVGRDDYTIAPGLYAVGRPGEASPVLVSANYKLSFDTLRKSLKAIDAWILVLDTRGINVWCAAGKQLLSTNELVQRIRDTQLKKIVTHRQLILPQLAATGVSAPKVKRASGFEVLWGPVRAADIEEYLRQEKQPGIEMRRVTFSLAERIVLIPVEISQSIKPTAGFIIAIFLLSGIGPEIFSVQSAWQRGSVAFTAYLGGLLAGAVATPVLLPWIPVRSFATKGALVGLVMGLVITTIFWNGSHLLGLAALLLMTVSVSSYVAMNFTGATPFTSPSGVEKEMRRAIPLQLAAAVFAIVLWTSAGFLS
ncbi:MAG: hypothetical protein JRE21_09265 [Deltaproteobacteria bacterium]|jgi:hypothetical protein|nr:hypothetical protein [Deltaproteobacteria bacterium]